MESEVNKHWLETGDSSLERNIISIKEGTLLFSAYDPDSVMAYNIPAGTIRQLCDGREPCHLKNRNEAALELSQGDKAKAAYIYPKPVGGYVSLALNGSRQQHSVNFSQPQHSIPRIVLGISSLAWDPWASCDAILELTKTHIEGDRFFLGASRGRGDFRGALTRSWLSIDPLISNICVAPQDIRASGAGPMNAYLQILVSLFQNTYVKPSIIIWIKGLTIKHGHTHGYGAVLLNERISDEESLKSGIMLRGAVAEVAVNWFSVSNAALNIDSGYEIIPGVNRHHPGTWLKAPTIIMVRKWKFWTRPELMTGVSSLLFKYSRDAHSCWFRTVVENCESDD